MKNNQLFKLFLVLLFSTAFIFSFSHFGAQAFENIQNTDGKFTANTYIGSLDVSGKTKEEAANLLQSHYVNWMEETKVTLQYQEKSATLDLDKFHLDANQTINTVKDGQKNAALIMIEKANVEEQLQLLFPELNSSDVNIEKLTQSLEQAASKFEPGIYTLDLYNNYLLAGSVKKDEIIETAEIPLKDVPDSLVNLLDKNNEIEIPASGAFTLLDYVKQKQLRLDSDTLNLLATAIYQVILPTNFTIVERNISSTLPNYAQLGYEAKANNQENADLAFTNTNKEDYIVKLQLDHDQLKVTLKGEKLLYTYKIRVKDQQKLAPKTIVQYSPLVSDGKTLVQTEGKPGQLVKVYRDIYQGEQFLRSQFISEDYYPPVERVEIHPLANSSQATTTVNQTATAAGSQTSTNSTSHQTGTQTNTSSDNVQPVSNQTDLWGQPNEQPK